MFRETHLLCTDQQTSLVLTTRTTEINLMLARPQATAQWRICLSLRYTLDALDKAERHCVSALFFLRPVIQLQRYQSEAGIPKFTL